MMAHAIHTCGCSIKRSPSHFSQVHLCPHSPDTEKDKAATTRILHTLNGMWRDWDSAARLGLGCSSSFQQTAPSPPSTTALIFTTLSLYRFAWKGEHSDATSRHSHTGILLFALHRKAFQSSRVAHSVYPDIGAREQSREIGDQVGLKADVAHHDYLGEARPCQYYMNEALPTSGNTLYTQRQRDTDSRGHTVPERHKRASSPGRWSAPGLLLHCSQDLAFASRDVTSPHN